MSKELYFTDGNNEVKYLDTTASFNLAITQDGSAFDLTNATAIDVKVANDTGYVFDKSIDMTTIKQPLAGLITMPVDAEVMNALVPDDYTIEVWVTLSSLITPGSQEGLTDTSTDGSTTGTTTSTTTSTTTDTTTYNAIFPSDDPQGFTITENVMSDSGDVIPVMSLDAFQQEFDQLKTDLTSKVATLQGPKGDTGDTGPIGPQGPVGSGLVVKGTVNDASQLPTTGNQEGYCYFVGNDLYVWDSGKWKNCGSVSPDLSNYVTVTDLNNGISTKVTDNKDGTEQLNGVQVQPFNKLSDTIGGRNLIVAKTIENSISLDSSGNPTGYSPSFLTDYIPVVANQKYTITIYGTTNSCSSRVAYYDSSKNFVLRGLDATISTGSSEVVSIPSGASYIRFSPNTPDQSGEYKDNFKIEKGSIATDWTPAPEDKVNVADMRKPASDVAGIEEVNAKQDKIGYTPADDSKVLHSTVTQLNSTDMDTVLTAGFYQLFSGTNGIPNGDEWTIYQVIPLSNVNGVQLAYETNNNILGMRSWNYTASGLTFSTWVQFADDSKVVHLSTGATANRPTGQVTGYQYFDTTLNKPIWYTGNNWVDATGTTV